MPVVTGLQVITDAFLEIGYLQQGETPGATDQADGLRRLNYLVGRWGIEGLSVPVRGRLVFPLRLDKGSSTNPYTIGVGGDLNTARPPKQSDLTGAGLLFPQASSTSGPLEIDRGILTDQGYEAERLKDLRNSLFTHVYYRPEFAGDLGSIFLWPVPTDLTNSLVLYLQQALGTFADTTTSYSVPSGTEEALVFNLALRFCRPYGRPVTPDLKQDAAESFNRVQMSNMGMSDLGNELAALNSGAGRGGYNIQTGE